MASLSPTSAASLFAASLVNWERVAAGVTLQTMWLPVTQGSSFCVGSVLWLLAADVLLFAALTWYFDKVRSTHAQCKEEWSVWIHYGCRLNTLACGVPSTGVNSYGKIGTVLLMLN